MSVPAHARARCLRVGARPARATVVAAVLLTAVGFGVTLFSAISACPVNLAGGLLMVGAGRPLRDAVHVHRLPSHRRLLHHQLHWSALTVVMLVAGSYLSAQSS